ncbi:UDP-2,3-diacylglucosamine diphosphatase LpxI [Phenylobacterium sp. LjRoot225]|uniref:UDP-2,3-diacylglucosamine diphosphatase n=1 Tax=Phenylobacterium sp. LjRoot225 TaxID=3342285 RepID=UPI003ECFD186
MPKLGLIAGGGRLPLEIAEHCRRVGRPLFVVRLKGIAEPALSGFEGADVGLAELGKCIRTLKRSACRAICLAGQVSRPDFTQLTPDLRGLAALPAVIAAARKGDDALLRFLLGEFEKEGFAIEGAEAVMGGLSLPRGPLGRHAPTPEQLADAEKAMQVARAIGGLDIGQGAVVCDGLVLAVEAQEGTDAMLARVATLAAHLHGHEGDRRGVLAKVPKPIQETRVDLPTMGLATVRAAATAGLVGIVGEAGRLLVLDRPEAVALADELGLFVLGVEPQGG